MHTPQKHKGRRFRCLRPFNLLTDLEDMSDWGGKCAGTALRIAGLLHCVENRTAPSKARVTERTMKRATKIVSYFLKHAQYAYSVMGADKTLHEAKYILRRLGTQSKEELTKSGLYHLCRNKIFKKADDMLPALELLIEYGYLKKEDLSPSDRRKAQRGQLSS